MTSEKFIKACENGNINLVKQALASGADNDQALRFASYYGKLEVVKLLLASGANIHADNDYALRRASYYGKFEVVKLLLASGANVHAIDDETLRWASHNGHTEVVKLFKNHSDNGECLHEFIPIMGIVADPLGYDCKLCGKKKEDC